MSHCWKVQEMKLKGIIEHFILSEVAKIYKGMGERWKIMPPPKKKISIDVQILNHSTYQQMGSLKRSHLN